MNILSYRGPGAPGGVSSGLARLWAEQKQKSGAWWFIDGNSWQELGHRSEKPSTLSELDEALLKGHYRFCNDFLWPVMHDLPQYATLNEGDQRLYRRFNERIAKLCALRGHAQPIFVQDYQFALIPRLVRNTSLVFWHIPWPANVLPEHVPAIREIAVGLLHADTLGFHTNEYARNFLQFVHTHINNCLVDLEENRIYRSVGSQSSHVMVAGGSPLTIYSNSSIGSLDTGAPDGAQYAVSQVIAQPLGIDMDFWSNLVAAGKNELLQSLNLSGQKFVLSVDRADYTKGVANRFRAIDSFFERNPRQRGQLQFVQVCGRSRAGLTAFDQYWHECRQLAESTNNRWQIQSDQWQPIRWLEESLNPAQLAVLYDAASAMLVNPVRDGLNLTAKEYVACQRESAGALVLSTRAGVWTELHQHALPVDPNSPVGIARAVEEALSLSPMERERRMRGMKQSVRSNSLRTWWQALTENLSGETAARRSA
ncbi:MAG: trehalose-6-phosphate synthase [Candidatus Obscuribacterales bacterium]